MNAKSRFLLMFASAFLLLLVTLIAPSSAKADTSSADQQFIINCHHSLNTSLQRTATAAGLKGTAIYSSIPRIDAAAMSCISGIMAAFNTNVSSSSPSSIIWGIVNTVVINLLINLANQACSMIKSDLNQIVSAASSLLNLACVPLPNLNLAGNLHLPHVPCNGTNLLAPYVTVGGGTQNQPGRWQLLGLH